MNSRFSQLVAVFITLALCVRPTPSHAETAGGSSGASTSSSSDSSDGFEMPQAQPIQPVQAPKPQSRSSDSGAASALAMVGAMTAMAMCAKLMNDARKAQAEGDKQSAQMYTMMAMMQCQQAAQNAANADKNKDQKDQLQENQTPQIAQAPAQKSMKVPSAPSDKIDQAGTATPPTSGSSDFPDPEVTTIAGRDVSGGTVGDSTLIPPSYARPGDGVIIPDLIDKSAITGNESAKGVDGAGNLAGTNPTGSFANSFASAMKGSSSGDLKGTNPGEGPLTAVNTRSNGSKGGGEGSGEGAASLGSKSEGGDGTNLNDMMASLFGAPGGAGAMGGFAGAQGIIDYSNVPTSPSTGKKMNIFEAASYLYQQANGKKVKRSKMAKNFKPFPDTQIATLSK